MYYEASVKSRGSKPIPETLKSKVKGAKFSSKATENERFVLEIVIIRFPGFNSFGEFVLLQN